MVKGRVCVSSRPINAAHYTPVNGIPRLHGHTFRITLCVSSEIGKDGMVLDFGVLDEFLEGVTNELDYSLLTPEHDKEIIKSFTRLAPFTIKAVYLPGPATAEVLGLWVCRKLVRSLPKLFKAMKTYVIIEEGPGHKAVVSCSFGKT